MMFPTGKRYVRYGVFARGKFHITRAENDYDGLCGVGPQGSSPCTATSDVLAQVGWLNAGHVCRRCIARLDDGR